MEKRTFPLLQKTKHIAACHFFIADRINAKELRVEHCPTDVVVANCFTKPLQGALFGRLRDQTLNVSYSDVARRSNDTETLSTYHAIGITGVCWIPDP